MKNIALIDLIFQILLAGMVFGAAYLAKKKKDFRRHCLILRIAIPLQVIAIAVIMLPSMLGFIRMGQRGLLFNIEMLTHHTLGLAVILLWIYINLVFIGIVKTRGVPVIAMRVALILWVLTLFLGIHTFILVWT
jgi:putative membrane protein